MNIIIFWTRVDIHENLSFIDSSLLTSLKLEDVDNLSMNLRTARSFFSSNSVWLPLKNLLIRMLIEWMWWFVHQHHHHQPEALICINCTDFNFHLLRSTILVRYPWVWPTPRWYALKYKRIHFAKNQCLCLIYAKFHNPLIDIKMDFYDPILCIDTNRSILTENKIKSERLAWIKY